MKVARMSNRPEPNLWLSWAGATASRGMLPAARVYACKALHLAPGDADVLAHLGSIQFRMERYDEAAASLEEAQSITPQSWTIAYLLAATKFALADLANSEVQFTKAIADCPDDATRRLLFAHMAYPISPIRRCSSQKQSPIARTTRRDGCSLPTWLIRSSPQATTCAA